MYDGFDVLLRYRDGRLLLMRLAFAGLVGRDRCKRYGLHGGRGCGQLGRQSQRCRFFLLQRRLVGRVGPDKSAKELRDFVDKSPLLCFWQLCRRGFRLLFRLAVVLAAFGAVLLAALALLAALWALLARSALPPLSALLLAALAAVRVVVLRLRALWAVVLCRLFHFWPLLVVVCGAALASAAALLLFAVRVVLHFRELALLVGQVLWLVLLAQVVQVGAAFVAVELVFQAKWLSCHQLCQLCGQQQLLGAGQLLQLVGQGRGAWLDRFQLNGQQRL